MMSDVLSNNYDSGPESEFDFQDFLDESKNDSKSKLERIRSKINGSKGNGAGGPTIIKAIVKASSDPSKPPLMLSALSSGGKPISLVNNDKS